MTVDAVNFCCPDYIVTMNELVKQNWNQKQGIAGVTTMMFTIRKDGRIEDVQVEKPSGFVASTTRHGGPCRSHDSHRCHRDIRIRRSLFISSSIRQVMRTRTHDDNCAQTSTRANRHDYGGAVRRWSRRGQQPAPPQTPQQPSEIAT